MRPVLEHAESVLSVLARIEVVVLEPVHLPVSLGASCAHGTDERTRTLLGLLDGQAEIHRVVDGEVALATRG
jgi:hypothetical protein